MTVAWLDGWAKRIKLTIDNGDIDAALEDFPVLVYLSASSGRTPSDVSAVFDELTSDANRTKIAVTISDAITECYVEIEKWDDANEKAWLWVKVPAIASGTDTELYLYYDKNRAANTDYVGDPNDVVTESVWDANFKLVSHMRDGADNQHIYDSTSNDNDGTKGAAGEPTLTAAGKIGEAQDYDGGDFIDFASAVLGTGDKTVSLWVKFTLGALVDVITNALGLAGANAGFDIWKEADNTLAFAIGNGVLANQFLQYSTGAIDANWHKLTMVQNSNQLFVYIDGGLDGSDLVTEEHEVAPNQNLCLGNRPAHDFGVTALIDEVRLSNTVRTLAWIAAEFESERDDLIAFGAEETATLIDAYWDFFTYG